MSLYGRFLAAALFVALAAAALLLPLPGRPDPAVAHAAPSRGIVTGFTIAAYQSPWSWSPVVRYYGANSEVSIQGIEYGENWIVGDQSWYIVQPDWANTWYQLTDGSYVYSAFIFIPNEGEVAPWYSEPDKEKYVVVDLSDQLAWAMLGSNVMRQMSISSGVGGATPTGTYYLPAWGRILNERMVSFDPNDYYDVHNVLYTQYFAPGGVALHLNYWRPDWVFGAQPTSHGCVGLRLADAQYLWFFGYPGMRVVVQA